MIKILSYLEYYNIEKEQNSICFMGIKTKMKSLMTVVIMDVKIYVREN